jgi:hypothetical protein
MAGDQLIFWKAGPDLRLPAQEVARELIHGEDVAGLIDLPIKAILDRLKEAFPHHREVPGELLVEAGAGSFTATWTWQHLRVELGDVPAADRERLIAVLETFGCEAFEP